MFRLRLVAHRAPQREEDHNTMSADDQIIINYNMPLMTDEEKAVWSVLCMCRGRELAILGPDIEELTGIRYKQVQKIINGLRCHHDKLIGSGTMGYYIPQTPEELDAVCHYIKGRAIMALRTWGRVKKISAEEIFQQLRAEFKEAG